MRPYLGLITPKYKINNTDSSNFFNESHKNIDFFSCNTTKNRTNKVNLNLFSRENLSPNIDFIFKLYKKLILRIKVKKILMF